MLGSGRIDAPLLVLLGLFLLQGGFVVGLHLQCGLIALEEVLAIIAVHTHTLSCTRERCTFGRHPGLESERRFGQVYATHHTRHTRGPVSRVSVGLLIAGEVRGMAMAVGRAKSTDR